MIDLLKRAANELTLVDTETDSSKNFASFGRRVKLVLEIKSALESHASKTLDGTPLGISDASKANHAATENDCQCRDCLKDKNDEHGMPLLSIRMTLCPLCGNKRCPHADNHLNQCTGSNEPGQAGSYVGLNKH